MSPGGILARAWAFVRRREPLVIISVHVMMVFLAWQFVIPVLPRYALDFGVTIVEVGLLLSALTLARIFTNFPAGAGAERVGRRAVLIAGGAIAGVASLGSGIAAEFPQLVAFRFLTGVGGAMAVTAEMTIMADLTTRENRARLMSFSETLVAVGLFLGPGIGGLLADAAGLRVPFYVIGACILVVTAWAAVRLPETRGLNADRLPPESAGRPNMLRSVRSLLMERNYVMIATVGFSTFLTRFATLFMLLPLIAYSRLGMTPGEYGLVASGIALLHVPLLSVSGRLVDRFGRKVVIVPTVMLAGVAIILLGLAPTREWFFAAAAFYALVTGIGGPAPGAYLADVAPSHIRGMSMGLYRTIADVAGFVGPLLLGALAQASTQGTAVVANGLFVCVAGLAFALLASETHAPRRLVRGLAPARRGRG